MTAPITPDDFPEIRWHGHWIWLGDAPVRQGSPFAWDRADRPEAHGLFRRSFTLETVPPRVPARLTADSRYMFWVNGTWIGHGPPRSQPRRMRYDMYDLAPHLGPGDNTIAVLVKYHGTPRTDWMPAVGNATLGKTGVLVFEADLGDRWLVSDESWASRPATGYSEDGRDPNAPDILVGVPVECFDARKAPAGWTAPDHDATGWTPARRIIPVHIGARGRSQPPTDPYGPLLPRSFAHLTGATRTPASVATAPLPAPPDLTNPAPAPRAEAAARTLTTAPTPATLAATLPLAKSNAALACLDMGRITAGFVDLALTAPAGTVLDIYYAEEPVAHPPEFGAAGGNRYIARGHDDRHRVFDKKGFRYAYILVHGATGPITLESFTVAEHHYPWTGTASFASSDPDLDRLYEAGRRTVALNSWDGFLDCPTREQRAWVGDAVVHQMVHLTTNADWRLARHYLELGNSPRPDGILPMSVAGDVEHGEGFTIPEWSLHWIHGVHNLYRYTGDRDAVKALMPTAERILRWYLPYLTRTGVLQDVPEWNLVDWSALYSEAQSAIVTALWARGLAEFAEMARWLGETASATWADDLHTRVHKGFNLFWDAPRGLYVDHAVDGVPQRPVNQLASALAIVSGLAPEDRWARIIDAITDEARLVVRSWMFPGAHATPDEARERFRRMTQGGLVPDWDVETEIVCAEPFMSYVVHDAVAQAGRAERLPALVKRWLPFLDDGYDTFGENWGVGTRAHGWSSTPTRDLVCYTLGVTPADPGFTRARIAPRPGPLAKMAGRVPTPHGEIAVALDTGTLTLDSPVPVILSLPGQPDRDLDPGRHRIAT